MPPTLVLEHKYAAKFYSIHHINVKVQMFLIVLFKMENQQHILQKIFSGNKE